MPPTRYKRYSFRRSSLNVQTMFRLDVEGLDFEISQEVGLRDFRPDVLCIETWTFTQNGTERKLIEILDLMKAHGYFAYGDTYINTIFVSNEAWKQRPV